MKHARLSSLVIFFAASILPASSARAAQKEAEREKHAARNEGEDSLLTERNREREQHQNSDKFRLVGVADSPDPYSIPVAGSLAITADFEARPTDAGAGNAKNDKTFAIRVTINVSRDGKVVDTVFKEEPFTYPTDLPASKYHPVTCALAWDGLDDNGVPFPDGKYTYTVQGTLVRYDVIGKGETKEHVVATSAVLSGTVTVDSTPPELSDFAPPDKTYTNDPRIPVSARATDAGSGIATVVLNVDENDVGSHDPATGIVSWTPTVDLPEKWIVVMLSASDAAGNVATATWKFCEDRTAPDGTPVAPAPDTWIGKARPQVVAAFTDELAGLNVESGSMTVGGQDADPAFDEATGQLSGAPPADLPEGTATIVAAMKDLAGNEGSVSWTFKVDLSPPEASQPSPADGVWTNDTMPEISLALADALSGVDASTVTMTVNADSEEPGFAEGRVTHTPGLPLPEGDVNVTVSASDMVGNAMPEPFEWTFGVDTTPATVSITSPSAFTNQVRPTVTVNASDALSGVNEDTLVVKLDGVVIGSGPGGYSCSPDWDLAEGQHTISAEVSDNAGNHLPVPKQYTFTVDVTPPHVEILSPADGAACKSLQPTASAIVIDVGSGLSGAPVKLELDAVGVVFEGSVGPGGLISWTPGADLVEGKHDVAVIAVDAVGNSTLGVSAASWSFYVVGDEIDVGPDGLLTVGEAIDAIAAATGGEPFSEEWTIVLPAGTYSEEIIIGDTVAPTAENPLTIRADGEAVFDGGGTLTSAFVVSADNLHLEGLTVQDHIGSGIVCDGAAGFVASGITSSSNGEWGIWVSSPEADVVGCRTIGNGAGGLYLYSNSSHTIIVLQNGISEVDAGIVVETDADGYAQLVNNTVVVSAGNAIVLGPDADGGDVWLRNNILSAGNFPLYVDNVLGADYAAGLGNFLTLDSDYNDLFPTGGANAVGWDGGSCSLDDWRTNTGHEQNSFSAEPHVADPAGGDFHLRSFSGRWTPGGWVTDELGLHSPCIDAGIELPGHEILVLNEPDPDGGKVNLGVHGGTAEASKGDTVPPAAPTDLEVTGFSTTYISLTWTANVEPDFDHYNVYRGTTATFTPSAANRIVDGLTQNSYVDTGVVAYAPYYYVVTATDTSLNESDPSPAVHGRAGSELTSPITVGPADATDEYDFNSIKEAVEALDAALGGGDFTHTWRIEIYGGTYREKVYIPSSLHTTEEWGLVIESVSDSPAILDGFNLGGPAGVYIGTDNVRLSGLEITRFSSCPGVEVFTHNVGVTGCVIEDVYAHHNGSAFSNSRTTSSFGRLELVNCTAIDNANAVYAIGGEVRLEGCEFYSSDPRYSNNFHHTGGTHLEIVASKMDGSGDFFSSTASLTLERSEIRAAQIFLSTYFRPLPDDVTIRNNVFDSGSILFGFRDYATVTVHNNTFYSQGQIDIMWLGNKPMVQLCNNIFSCSGEGSMTFGTDDFPFDLFCFESDYNNWHSGAGPFKFNLGSTTEYEGLSEWRSRPQPDPQNPSEGRDLSSIEMDPLFADASGGDFHLMSPAGRWDPTENDGLGGWVTRDTVASPCIDAGDPTMTDPDGSRINMGRYGGTPEASKRVPSPRVLWVKPAGSPDVVPLNSPIEVGCSEDMGSVDASLMYWDAGANQHVQLAGAWGIQGNVMRFMPTDDLLPCDTSFVVTFSADSTTSVSGMTLDGSADGVSRGSPEDDYVFSFKTRPAGSWAGGPPGSDGQPTDISIDVTIDPGIDPWPRPPKYLTNKKSLETVTVSVASGTASDGGAATYTVSLTGAGQQAPSTSEEFTFSDVPLPEEDGEHVIEAFVTDANGGNGYAKIIVVIDRTLPEIDITLPHKLTSGHGHGSLIVGRREIEIVTDTTPPENVPYLRNVIALDSLWNGSFTDTGSGIKLCSATRRLSGDDGSVCELFREEPAEPVASCEFADVTVDGDNPPASGWSDQSGPMVFEVEDWAGNHAEVSVTISIDVVEPSAGPAFSWQVGAGIFGIATGHEVISLAVGLDEAALTSVRKTWSEAGSGAEWDLPDGFAAQVTYDYHLEAGYDLCQAESCPIFYEAEDYAGNVAKSSFTHAPTAVVDNFYYNIDLAWATYNEFIDAYDYFSEGTYEGTTLASAYQKGTVFVYAEEPTGEEVERTVKTWIVGEGDLTVFEHKWNDDASWHKSEAYAADIATVTFPSMDAPIIITAPHSSLYDEDGDWTDTTPTYVEVTGLFPKLDEFFPVRQYGLNHFSMYFAAGPLCFDYCTEDEPETPETPEDPEPPEAPLTITEAGIKMACEMEWLNIADEPRGKYERWQYAGYNRAWLDWQGRDDYGESPPDESWYKDEEREIGWYGFGVEEPRAINCLCLRPDTVLSGGLVTLKLRGGFPAEGVPTVLLKKDTDNDVADAPDTIEPVSIRLLEEDLYRRDIWRTIEFTLDLSDAAEGEEGEDYGKALGFYDIEVTCKKVTQEEDLDADPPVEEEYEGVDAYEMDKVLKILKIDLVDQETQQVVGDEGAQPSVPMPRIVITSPTEGASVSGDSVTVQGYVLDPIADIAEDPLPDGILTVKINGEELTGGEVTFSRVGTVPDKENWRANFSKALTLTETGLGVSIEAENIIGNKTTAGMSVIRTKAGYVPSEFEVVADINFAPDGYVPPAFPYYELQDLDSGHVFDAARGYGWDQDVTALAIEREDPHRPPSWNTFINVGEATRTWELAVENGTFVVSLGCGDTEAASGPHEVFIEGQLAIDNVDTAEDELARVGDFAITVADGRLSVTLGDAGAPTNINYIVVRRVVSWGSSGTAQTSVSSVYSSPELPYPRVYFVRVGDVTPETPEDVTVGSLDLDDADVHSKTLPLEPETGVEHSYVTQALMLALTNKDQPLPTLPDGVNVVLGYDLKSRILYEGVVKETEAMVEILNPIYPTKGKKDDSDDCYVAGEGADIDPEGDVVPVRFYYILREDVDSVVAEVIWHDSAGGQQELTLTQHSPGGQLLGTEANQVYCVEWNGKDSSGDFVFDRHGRVYFLVKATKNGKTYDSNAHQMLELSRFFRPDIYLQQSEFSAPIRTSLMLNHYRLYDTSPWSNDWITPGPNLSTLLSTYNDFEAFMDLHDPTDDVTPQYANWRKAGLAGTGDETPTLYTHAQTLPGSFKEGTKTIAAKYVFVQYWMFYPSSTKAIAGTYGNGNATTQATQHEGDWEMFMNVVELDPGNKQIWLRSCTASQHYVGQTLPTKTGRFAGQAGLTTKGVDYVDMNGSYPQIFVGAGSHATFFKSDTFAQAWTADGWVNVYKNPKPNSASLIDTTKPLKDMKPATADVVDPVVCEIVPLDYNTAQWKGYWGDADIGNVGPWEAYYNDGPPSPAHRKDDWEERILPNPKKWHNRFVRVNVKSKADQPFVTLP